MPVMTMKKKEATGVDSRVQTCIVTENAASVETPDNPADTSESCKAVINTCKSGQENTCNNIISYASTGTTDQQTAAKKVLRAVCDAGGDTACDYFLMKCIRNSSDCDIAASDYDIRYYLTLLADSSNSGRLKMLNKTSQYYLSELSSIVNETHNACSSANPSTACKLIGDNCDAGKNIACAYFVDRCKDSAICDVASSDYDIRRYLLMATTDTNPGRQLIQTLAQVHYNNTIANIVDEVNADCCNPDFNTACSVKGLTSCPSNWAKKIGGVNDDWGYGIAIDSSGNVYLTGYQASATYGGNDIAVIKLDSSGTMQWQKKIGGASDDRGNDIAVDSSGNIYITGCQYSDAYGNFDIAVIKLNSSGTMQWQKKIGGASDDRGNGITIDNSGNVYLTGYQSSDSYGTEDIAVIKLDSSGTIQWQKKIGGANSDISYEIAVDNSGNVYATGYQFSNVYGNYDIFLIKLDSSGTIQWQKKIGGTSIDIGLGIAVDSSENVYLTGYQASDTYGGNDIFAIKLNSSGTIQWQKKIGGANGDISYAIAVDNSGNVYLTGYQASDTYGGNDIAVIKLDSSGTMQWQKKIGGASDDNGIGIAVDSNGNMYVSGRQLSNTYGLKDIAIIKMNTTQTSNMSLSISNSTLSISASTLSVGTSTLGSGDSGLSSGDSALSISDMTLSGL
ncbi:MAG: SBBP repeat-containing protein [bacterium]